MLNILIIKLILIHYIAGNSTKLILITTACRHKSVKLFSLHYKLPPLLVIWYYD